jgi:hypothetical protein
MVDNCDENECNFQSKAEESFITKKQKIMDALVEEGLTEKAILEKVGDNRYSRTIIRDLLQSGNICRHGKVCSTELCF